MATLNCPLHGDRCANLSAAAAIRVEAVWAKLDRKTLGYELDRLTKLESVAEANRYYAARYPNIHWSTI